MHDVTGNPSSSTVQAPHSPASQPGFEPVKSNSSRSKRRSVFAGGALTFTDLPFNVNLMKRFVLLAGDLFRSIDRERIFGFKTSARS